MRNLRCILLLAAAAAIVSDSHAGEVKTGQPGMGPETVVVSEPDPTSAGSFDGTWMYVNRDGRWALWLRTRNGAPQIKIQFQSLANPEAFETDWDGNAVYYLSGSPVTFSVKIGTCTADQIQARWSWDVKLEDSRRRENADLVIFRTGYGRTLSMDFRNFEKVITRRGKDSVMKVPFNWTWHKISKRELIWDELPF